MSTASRMRGGAPAAAVVATVVAALAGCGAAPDPVVPPPPAPPARSAADSAACARHAEIAELVRSEARAYDSTPVPPVRVALVLASTWEFYNASGAQDSVLVATMAEVAAAIGDLDAQGQAAMAPGGTLLDPVKIDPARTRAAVDAVDMACADARSG